MADPVSRRTALKSALAAGMLPGAPSLATQPAATAALARVQVAPGGHLLQRAGGAPFFWLADTAWQLLQWLTWDECRYYLQTRARQGFTVVQASVLCEFGGAAEPTAMGLLPFAGGDRPDITRPDDRFFDYVVRVADEAARLGLYMALLPTWGDKVTGPPWGAGPRLFRTDNLAQTRGYARYLARRLRDRTNVLWMLGGDRPLRVTAESDARIRAAATNSGFPQGADWQPVWDAFAAGIADEAPQPLLLYHPQGGEQSTSQLMGDVRWLSVNGMQSGHGAGHNVPVWRWVARDYAGQPARPTVDLEPNYEDHPVNPWPHWDPANGYFDALDVRRQSYRSVFAGACGVTYGNHSVWQFAGSRPDTVNHVRLGWRDALVRPGAQGMVYLRDLILSRPFLSRMPAPELLPGMATELDGSRVAVATRAQDRSYAMVYIPNAGQPVELDLSGFAAALQGWWYSPVNGIGSRVQAPFRPARQSVTSPIQGEDWVLVLDDPAAAFAPPGIR